jgi:hypothetical protein
MPELPQIAVIACGGFLKINVIMSTDKNLTQKNNSEFKIINRHFDIDWEKLQTVEDIKSLLKGLQLQVNLYSETIPDHLKECFEKDFLIERKSSHKL